MTANSFRTPSLALLPLTSRKSLAVQVSDLIAPLLRFSSRNSPSRRSRRQSFQRKSSFIGKEFAPRSSSPLDFDVDLDSAGPIVGLGPSPIEPSAFLGRYSADYLWSLAADFGITDSLAERGFPVSQLRIRISPTDGFVHRMTVLSATATSESDFLIDVWVRLQTKRVHDWSGYQELLRLAGRGPTESLKAPRFPLDDLSAVEAASNVELLTKNFSHEVDVTSVQWLELRDPTATFTRRRPPLPGQARPGLGAARKVSRLILALTEHRGRDMLANSPDHWHLAVAYNRKGFKFLAPAMQGFVEASENDLCHGSNQPFAAIAWAWKLGFVKLDGKPIVWSSTQDQLYPTSPRTRDYFHSDTYLNAVAKAKKMYEGRFSLDLADPTTRKSIAVAMDWDRLV